VLNPGVDPILCCYYKSSRLKQYFKEGRALRTETVISNSKDFDVGRRMCAENWKALRAAGESVNRRLCEAEAADAKPAPDALLHAPYGPRQSTYDLRRLQRKGLIAKLPRGHTYRLTSVGRRVAVLFTKAYGRVLAPGLSALDLHFPDDVLERRPLSRTWRSFDKVLDDFVEQQMVAD